MSNGTNSKNASNVQALLGPMPIGNYITSSKTPVLMIYIEVDASNV